MAIPNYPSSTWSLTRITEVWAAWQKRNCMGGLIEACSFMVLVWPRSGSPSNHITVYHETLWKKCWLSFSWENLYCLSLQGTVSRHKRNYTKKYVPLLLKIYLDIFKYHIFYYILYHIFISYFKNHLLLFDCVLLLSEISEWLSLIINSWRLYIDAGETSWKKKAKVKQESSSVMLPYFFKVCFYI